jgi:hypothetical protein
MIERVITSLNTVASAILLDTPDNPLCLSITSLFPTISFTDTVGEWCVNYLEDGPNNAELVPLTPPERKAHFINFMRNKYGGLITNVINELIIRDADLFETAGVFVNMAMGIRKYKKSKKRNQHKKSKKRNQHKKSKKRNQHKKSKRR